MSEVKVRIHRSARRVSYTVIDNRILQGDWGSIEAKGVLCHLLSLPDDWTISLGQLSRLHKIGRDKMQRIMAEIRDAGYACLATLRDEKTGHLSGRVWIVMEEPAEAPGADHHLPENPSVGGSTESLKNRPTEKPSDGFSGSIQSNIDIQITDSDKTPTPAARGASRERSREEIEKALAVERAEARWEAFKLIWPFDPAARPGKARAAFLELSPEERELAIQYAPRYIEATTEKKRAHPGNWLAGREWTGFVEQDAAAKAAQTSQREKLAELHDRQRAKYGGVLIRWGSQQNAAWARHDEAIGVNWRRELRDYPIGQAYVRPSEWPPSAPRPTSSEQPETRSASP